MLTGWVYLAAWAPCHGTAVRWVLVSFERGQNKPVSAGTSTPAAPDSFPPVTQSRRSEEMCLVFLPMFLALASRLENCPSFIYALQNSLNFMDKQI